MALSTAQPKPIKRATEKRKRDEVKTANICNVRERVEARDGERCRIGALLGRFGFNPSPYVNQRVELAHVEARGMGGNPNLSRDSTENTVLIRCGLHQGLRSHHSGHLKIRALTDKGADGPCVFEFYEQLPTEVT